MNISKTDHSFCPKDFNPCIISILHILCSLYHTLHSIFEFYTHDYIVIKIWVFFCDFFISIISTNCI